MLFEGKERKQREQEMQKAGRLPPGQALTLKWPVLHYGSVPRFDPATWDFRVFGLVEKPVQLSWDEFNHLPKAQITSDSIASPAGAASIIAGMESYSARSSAW